MGSRRRKNDFGSNSRSRSRPSPASSGCQETSVIEPGVLMSLNTNDLFKGFAEVQRKLIQILTALEQSENVAAFIQPSGPVSVGINTLREIATALIEKDPHFACSNRVYDDLWLMGFTRPIKLSNKLEVSGSEGLDGAVREWRTWFMLDWHGYLSKLHDTLEMYQEPQSVLAIFPSMSQCLPGGYFSFSKDPCSSYQLPITYLLRDIALCIARIQSHINPQLEKFWMQRALSLNIKLKGRPYSMTGRRQPIKPANVHQLETPVGILARTEVCDDTAAVDDIEVEISEDVSDEALPEENTFCRNGYGRVTASHSDIQRLRPFVERNSFIQGLVAAAAIQGIDIDSDGSSVTS